MDPSSLADIDYDLEEELNILSEETLDQLCIDDDTCWLIVPPPSKNSYDDECDINEWLLSVLFKRPSMVTTTPHHTRINKPNYLYYNQDQTQSRDTNVYADLPIHHQQQQQNNYLSKPSNPRVNTMMNRYVDQRSEMRYLSECRDNRFDTRTITKKRPSIFNRFSSTEELSQVSRSGSRGNLYNNKLNLSSHNICGSNGNLTQTILYNNSSPENNLNLTHSARKNSQSKLNSTFTKEEESGITDTPITRRDQSRVNIINGNSTVTRKTEESSKKKPLSMYAVYAEPTDSRPVRSTNSTMLSAYRKFKSSALNRQFTENYREEDILKNTMRYSPGKFIRKFFLIEQ